MRNLIQHLSLRVGLFLQKSIGLDKAREVLDLMRPRLTDLDLVRVGSQSDGGYLVPRKIADSCEAVFSPGVASVADFERFFLDKGVPCFMIDGSVERAPLAHPNAHFSKLWLSAETKEGSSVSLEDWVRERGQGSDNLLLQMDIEGAEYECLLTTPESILLQFSCLVVEFHDLHSTLFRSGFRLVGSLMERLNRTHTVVHFHVNNVGSLLRSSSKTLPDTVELTLVRNDLIGSLLGFADIPHQLDSPNNPSKGDSYHEF